MASLSTQQSKQLLLLKRFFSPTRKLPLARASANNIAVGITKNTRKTGSLKEGQGVHCDINELIALKQQKQNFKLSPRHKSKALFSGGHRSALRGRGIDFDEVRAYQAGDDIRSIDWRVTARTGKTHTKIFHEDKERPVFILLDQRQSMFFGSVNAFKSVIATQAAALIAWSTVQKGDRLGAFIFSDVYHREQKPRTGNKAVLEFIHSSVQFNEALALGDFKPAFKKTLAFDIDRPTTFGQQTKKQKATNSNNKPQVLQQSLTKALIKLKQVAKPGSTIVILSDFKDFNDEAEQHLAMLSRHNDIIPFFVYDPLEKTLPPAGHYAFSDINQQQDASQASTNPTEQSKSGITQLNTADTELRQRYQDDFKQGLNALTAKLQSYGIFLRHLNTAEAIDDQLNQELRS